ncbi:hypothetical protein HANVADRAFT_46976 [Hanseniaspora valbyensis NRRL Y-1626]|uniref:Striatin N-terminal domain-containing protein n=1 Tax=Hanseniaspora valbyensis NRRL Y-1626 TaxID=766949 RepID=A0A1B7TJ51_9ASCO|nr:hypothetical protein HANVADRAFT_46976 [Hanseniaspora valbyensis NRRL Y-1626]
MDTQNLNLITVIKYLQEQYTLNERNRINYELLLKNKQLQKNKLEANKALNHSLANLNLNKELENSQQVHEVINNSKQKLSSVLKDIKILLNDSDSVKDVVYNRLDQKDYADEDNVFDGYKEKLDLIVTRRFNSNINNLSKVIPYNNDKILLVDFENGMLEARSLCDGTFKILKQEVNELLKDTNQCWYLNNKDVLLINKRNTDSIININDGNAINLNKKDLFYKFDYCCDFKYDKLIFIDGCNSELIKIVDVATSKNMEVDLSKLSVYNSNQKVLDLKFGITETSILVLTQKSLLIIDYHSNTVLTELKLDTNENKIVEGILTVNTNFNNLLLTFIEENNTVKNYVYSLEMFQIANELTHSFNFLNGDIKQLLAIDNIIYYLFDEQIQVRTKEGALKNRYLINSENILNSIVVNENKLYHISQKTKNNKVMIHLLECE